MEADHPCHDISRRSIVRRADTGQIILELGQPAVGAEQRQRREP
ncbi:Uncharacterised protein [Mycobacterium tuberculosis]|nr:Uncharacterised protein [Mycobacterium tuberculosis]COZ83354.1 Uncharacterised protein [Mycobacterium tuberculosis]